MKKWDRIFNIIILILFIVFVLIVASTFMPIKQLAAKPKPQISEYDIVAKLIEEAPEPMPEYEISLSYSLQKYTFNLCNTYDLSYSLVLSLMYQESKFNPDAINVNKNQSRDEGICQLNQNFSMELASRAGYSEDKFDAFNARHNIKTAIVHLNGLREYWKTQGYDSDEDLFWLILGSFNRGTTGMKTYMKNNGTMVTDYALNLAKWKELLETEGRLE
jgi:soluble lytic murein transglycosylase-like protein